MFFIGKYDDISIEEYIKSIESLWGNQWKNRVWLSLKDDVMVWWYEVKSEAIHALSDKEYENLFLDKWSHAKIKYKDYTKGLFSHGNSILQVRGCIQKENIIVSINPSCMHNFINVQLVNRLQVHAMNIQST
jgi:hypothetical protein